MTGLPSEVDIAVIGAGAAGIGAARCLREAGMASIVVLRRATGSAARPHDPLPGFHSIAAPNGCTRPIATRSRRSPKSRLSASTAAGVDDTAAPQR